MPHLTHILTTEPPYNSANVLLAIKELHNTAKHALEPTVATFQQLIHRLAGQQFGDFERNRIVASAIDELLIFTNQRVRCPKEGCGEPSVITYSAAGTAKYGVFELRHSKQGRAVKHGVSTTLLPYILVDAPPDPRRKS